MSVHEEEECTRTEQSTKLKGAANKLEEDTTESDDIESWTTMEKIKIWSANYGGDSETKLSLDENVKDVICELEMKTKRYHRTLLLML